MATPKSKLAKSKLKYLLEVRNNEIYLTFKLSDVLSDLERFVTFCHVDEDLVTERRNES